MLKKYFLPVIIGAIAGAVVLWGFDSFAARDAGYFAKLFLKSLVPVVIAVAVIIQLKKNKAA